MATKSIPHNDAPDDDDIPDYFDVPEAPPTKSQQLPPVRVEDALYIHACMTADRKKWSLSTLIREALSFYLAELDD